MDTVSPYWTTNCNIIVLSTKPFYKQNHKTITNTSWNIDVTWRARVAQ